MNDDLEHAGYVIRTIGNPPSLLWTLRDPDGFTMTHNPSLPGLLREIRDLCRQAGMDALQVRREASALEDEARGMEAERSNLRELIAKAEGTCEKS